MKDVTSVDLNEKEEEIMERKDFILQFITEIWEIYKLPGHAKDHKFYLFLKKMF